MTHRQLIDYLPVILVLGLGALMFVAYGTRWALVGRSSDPRLQREQAMLLLGRFPMEAFHWSMRSLATTLVRHRFNPDLLTFLSLGVTGLTLPTIAVGAFSWGALAMLVGSALDALDGIVARQEGVASDSGEVLDAVIDRYADAMPLAGLLLYYRESSSAMLMVMVAWVGSYSISYMRAKAEAMAVTLGGSLMRRPERLLYIGLALLLGPQLPSWEAWPVPRPLTPLVVGCVGLLSNLVTVQMVIRTRRVLVQGMRGPREPHHD